ncbi:MAG: FadR/GntR family transcriptional regulator [Clostridiaceae bacterium]
MKSAVAVQFIPESIRGQVARELERRIFSGELAIGERLPPERDLAKLLGVSRSLVNLAILDLESMGFVRIVPRQGTFVADYKTQSTPQMLLSLMTHGAEDANAELFASMMETRRLLETECARLVTEKASDEELKKLTALLDTMRASREPAQFSQSNFRFHRAMLAASGNIVYAMIFQSFEQVVLYYVTSYFTTPERISLSILQHERLMEALSARNAERARAEIERIMEEGISNLTRMFSPKELKSKNPPKSRA